MIAPKLRARRSGADAAREHDKDLRAIDAMFQAADHELEEGELREARREVGHLVHVVSHALAKTEESALWLSELRRLVRAAERLGRLHADRDARDVLYAQFMGVVDMDDPEDRGEGGR